MTIQRHAARFLLLLALLAGQWLSVAHSHDDSGIDADHVCQLCLHAVQLDAFLPAPELLPLTPASRSVSHSRSATPAAARHSRFHDSRAPPRGWL
jgi:hypothetical protein